MGRRAPEDTSHCYQSLDMPSFYQHEAQWYPEDERAIKSELGCMNGQMGIIA